MSEQETAPMVVSIPIDLEDLFCGPTIIRGKFKGRDLRFTLREVDNQTDNEYQKRSAKTVVGKDGKPRFADESLSADCWYFDALCQSVEVITENSAEPLIDFKAKVSPELKRSVIFYYRQRIGPAEIEPPLVAALKQST